jgi:copper chaperone CopZ
MPIIAIPARPLLEFVEKMKTNYSISGMHCQSCERKVQQALAGLPGVNSADVSLATASATINSARHVPLSELNAAVKQAGDYLVNPAASDTACEVAEISPTNQSWLATYKPLLIIAAYILGGTVLIAQQSGNWQAMALMNSFMGLFFVVFSFFKLLDIAGFARAYSSYDVIAARWSAYGYIYPWLELALGIGFLLEMWPVAINSATAVLMAVSIIGVLNAVMRKQNIQCGCLGTVFKLPMSVVTIIEDALMGSMAVASLLLMR